MTFATSRGLANYRAPFTFIGRERVHLDSAHRASIDSGVFATGKLAVMKKAYLALGSNLGDRAGNIGRAIEALEQRGLHVTKRSALYETEPVQARGGWFVNAAAELETELRAEELMSLLLQIERSLGRKRTEAATAEPSGSAGELKDERAIDLDILLFGGQVIEAPGLRIPHPRMADRRFVLAPLAEIAPEIVHPVLKKTIAELLVKTPDTSEVKRLDSTNSK